MTIEPIGTGGSAPRRPLGSRIVAALALGAGLGLLAISPLAAPARAADEAAVSTEEPKAIIDDAAEKIVAILAKKDRPADAELKKLLLGPTGNLRAPALRKGKTLVVGFDEATYRKVFG